MATLLSPPAAVSFDATASLDACVRQATARVRLRRALWGGATGLCAGVLPSLVLIAGLRLSAFADALAVAEPYVLLPPLLGALIWGGWSATRPVSPQAVARRIDDALGLEDRFSSALAFAEGYHGDDSLRRMQARDAEVFARDLARRPVELRAAVPLAPLPLRAWAGLAGFALVAGLMFAPSLTRRTAAAKPDTKTEQAQVQKEGERLLRLARTLEARDKSKGNAAPHASDARRVAAERLAKLGDEMKRGKLTRREAMIKAAKLTEEVKQTQRALASDRNEKANQKSLMAAARELETAMQNAQKQSSQTGAPNGLNNAPIPTPPVGANRKTNGAQNGAKSPAQQKLDGAQKALAQNDAPALSQQLRKLADDMAQGEPKNAKEREKVARQVDALGKSLEKTRLGDASKSLREAAKAAQSGDNKTAADKMHEAAASIEQAEQRTGDAEAMQNAADGMENKQGDDERQAQAATGEQQQAAEQAAQAGKGASDAFDANGKIKQSGNGAAGKDGKGKDSKNGKGRGSSGQGRGKGTGNGIGTKAEEHGGPKRPAEAAGPYQDPRGARAGLNKGKAGQKPLRNEKFTRLYAPDDQIPVTRVKGKRGDAGKESVSPFQGAPDKNAKPSSVPYYEVYGKYAPAAESAQRREDLPAPYKKQVKEYFDALRPDAGSGKPAPPQRKP